jgi:hypothetical protein
MILVLHGTSAFKIILILAANYAIAKQSTGSVLGIYATWAVNIAMLFGNEIFDGYQYGSLHPSLALLVRL